MVADGSLVDKPSESSDGGRERRTAWVNGVPRDLSKRVAVVDSDLWHH